MRTIAMLIASLVLGLLLAASLSWIAFWLGLLVEDISYRSMFISQSCITVFLILKLFHRPATTKE